MEFITFMNVSSLPTIDQVRLEGSWTTACLRCAILLLAVYLTGFVSRSVNVRYAFNFFDLGPCP